MTFSAIPVTFLLLGLVPLYGPSKRDACPPMASFMTRENKFWVVKAAAKNDSFDDKDQMIHSMIVHENLLLSNNNTNSRAINLSPLHEVITLCLHSIGLYTQSFANLACCGERQWIDWTKKSRTRTVQENFTCGWGQMVIPDLYSLLSPQILPEQLWGWEIWKV